jgi:hypothetical protein
MKFTNMTVDEIEQQTCRDTFCCYILNLLLLLPQMFAKYYMKLTVNKIADWTCRNTFHPCILNLPLLLLLLLPQLFAKYYMKFADMSVDEIEQQICRDTFH